MARYADSAQRRELDDIVIVDPLTMREDAGSDSRPAASRAAAPPETPAALLAAPGGDPDAVTLAKQLFGDAAPLAVTVDGMSFTVPGWELGSQAADSMDADGLACWESVDILLLDNGRSRMLAHPVTRQSLACIRCGACLNVCPVYQQVGGHAYGSVYPGPIGAVITPQLMGIEKTSQLPYASSLCGACREVCPVKIDIPRLLLHLRGEISERKGSAGERLVFKLWARVMMSPALYKMSAVAGRLLQRVVPISRAWTSERDLRPVEQEFSRVVV